jgi:hypothetical protein
MENLTFSQALEACKDGHRIARAGWNGKGMYVWELPGEVITEDRIEDPIVKRIAQCSGSVTFDSTLRMKTATGSIQTGWLASQADMFAEDWMVFPK